MEWGNGGAPTASSGSCSRSAARPTGRRPAVERRRPAAEKRDDGGTNTHPCGTTSPESPGARLRPLDARRGPVVRAPDQGRVQGLDRRATRSPTITARSTGPAHLTPQIFKIYASSSVFATGRSTSGSTTSRSAGAVSTAGCSSAFKAPPHARRSTGWAAKAAPTMKDLLARAMRATALADSRGAARRRRAASPSSSSRTPVTTAGSRSPTRRRSAPPGTTPASAPSCAAGARPRPGQPDRQRTGTGHVLRRLPPRRRCRDRPQRECDRVAGRDRGVPESGSTIANATPVLLLLTLIFVLATATVPLLSMRNLDVLCRRLADLARLAAQPRTRRAQRLGRLPVAGISRLPLHADGTWRPRRRRALLPVLASRLALADGAADPDAQAARRSASS